MHDFKLLKPISNLFHILGWCVGIILILLGCYFMSEGGHYGVLPGMGTILGGIIVGAFLLLVSNLINLFLQIEENTRKKS